eukprot:354411-Chlamydomonas_euryale.AAC.18
MSTNATVGVSFGLPDAPLCAAERTRRPAPLIHPEGAARRVARVRCAAGVPLVHPPAGAVHDRSTPVIGGFGAVSCVLPGQLPAPAKRLGGNKPFPRRPVQMHSNSLVVAPVGLRLARPHCAHLLSCTRCVMFFC